ncbi:MAG: hypothetical protein PHH09_03990 [Methanoregulaceae archaeon]|nr:hypothetical protein [Methanoregulaceae archaeon]
MRCEECARLVCPLRGTPGVTGCRDGVSHEIMDRVMRDTPPNEAKIRGMQGVRPR